MSSMPTDLLRDPWFQLNTLLWLTQPLPEESDIAPVLQRQGFAVHAIAPPLGVPLDMRLAAQQAAIQIQDSARPDVVLARESDGRYALTECKASSFGPDSDRAEQARAFLVMAGPRSAEVLGLGPGQVHESILGYVSPENQRVALHSTLQQLAEMLNNNHLPTGRFSILGIEIAGTELRVVIDDAGSAFFSLTQGRHMIMRLRADTDPRPLYFIPYDPDLNLSQREKEFSKRVLFERIHGSVLVAVGRATPPSELLLEVNKLLNDAMFGVYALWENRASARHMRQLCRQLMTPLSQAINSEVAGSITYESDIGWKINIGSSDQQQKVIDALTRFSCTALDLRAEPQMELFDRE